MTSPSPTRHYPDFAVIRCSVDIDGPAQDVWRAIGTYADAGAFLVVPSRLIAGDGGIGSLRLVGDAIVEVMVGSSDTSYAYAQVRGPMATLGYHGCVAVEAGRADGGDRCTLLYTLTFDAGGLDAQRRAQEVERLRERFQGAVQAMKKVAESAISRST